jgi:hypothetical protein
MTDTVTYQEKPYTVTIKQLEWQKRGLQQTASGYGRKLTTEYMVHIPTSVSGRLADRAYRVYAICFSNVASFYIIRKGMTLFLRDWELEEARDAARG